MNKRIRKEVKYMLEMLKVIFLGIVEGITEWLPISSTGHMILVDEFLKLNVTEEFKNLFFVVIQLGAILAVVVLYWNKLWPFYIRPVSAKKQAILDRQPTVSRGILTFVEKFCDKDKWVLWFKIIVACIPTILIGLPFNDVIEEKFNNYVVVAIALIFYGILFIVIENLLIKEESQPVPVWINYPLRRHLLLDCFRYYLLFREPPVLVLPLLEVFLQVLPVQ